MTLDLGNVPYPLQNIKVELRVTVTLGLGNVHTAAEKNQVKVRSSSRSKQGKVKVKSRSRSGLDQVKVRSRWQDEWIRFNYDSSGFKSDG